MATHTGLRSWWQWDRAPGKGTSWARTEAACPPPGPPSQGFPKTHTPQSDVGRGRRTTHEYFSWASPSPRVGTTRSQRRLPPVNSFLHLSQVAQGAINQSMRRSRKAQDSLLLLHAGPGLSSLVFNTSGWEEGKWNPAFQQGWLIGVLCSGRSGGDSSWWGAGRSSPQRAAAPPPSGGPWDLVGLTSNLRYRTGRSFFRVCCAHDV